MGHRIHFALKHKTIFSVPLRTEGRSQCTRQTPIDKMTDKNITFLQNKISKKKNITVLNNSKRQINPTLKYFASSFNKAQLFKTLKRISCHLGNSEILFPCTT